MSSECNLTISNVLGGLKERSIRVKSSYVYLKFSGTGLDVRGHLLEETQGTGYIILRQFHMLPRGKLLQFCAQGKLPNFINKHLALCSLDKLVNNSPVAVRYFVVFSVLGPVGRHSYTMSYHSKYQMNRTVSEPAERRAYHDDPTKAQRVKEDKAKFQNRTLAERRSQYKCKENYETLDNVLTWPQYAERHAQTLAKRRTSPKKEQHFSFDVNEKLNSKVSIWIGDITVLEIDAIGNAANNSLLGGGGVDGCIHRGAGVELKRECSLLHGCETGDAKITLGYKLPAKHVIHTVGPIGKHPEALKSCYSRSLQLLKENNLKSLAMPCISTGIFGYPNYDAANVALKTVRDWLLEEENADLVDRIIFCLFLKEDVKIYERLMQTYFPMKSDEDPKDLSEDRSPKAKMSKIEKDDGEDSGPKTVHKRGDGKTPKQKQESPKKGKTDTEGNVDVEQKETSLQAVNTIEERKPQETVDVGEKEKTQQSKDSNEDDKTKQVVDLDKKENLEQSATPAENLQDSKSTEDKKEEQQQNLDAKEKDDEKTASPDKSEKSPAKNKGEKMAKDGKGETKSSKENKDT
ncbi:uncharacterized protein LOC144444093 [Glandiceps talaboti]